MLKNLKTFIFMISLFAINSFELLSEENIDSTKMVYRTIQIDATGDVIQHEKAFSIGISRFQYLDYSQSEPLSAFITINFNFFNTISLQSTLIDCLGGFRMDDRDKNGFWIIQDFGSGISFFKDRTFLSGFFRTSIGYSKYSFIMTLRVYSSKDMDMDILSGGFGYNF